MPTDEELKAQLQAIVDEGYGDPVIEPPGEVEELSIKSEPEPPEQERTSGTLILKFHRSIVKRDAEGRITEIIGEGTRKLVKRDEGGRIVEVIEEEESEL